MLRFLFYIFLIYLAYQFIFNFLFPVFKTMQQVKKGFREMHHHANSFQNEQRESSSQRDQTQGHPGNKKVGDYIDFEEIK